MNDPEEPKPAKQKLAWYQMVWVALPIGLVSVGGALGGAFGGGAFGLNMVVFEKTKNPVLRYVYTGLITAGAGAAYVLSAGVVMALIHGNK